jgi:hypothetical protein
MVRNAGEALGVAAAVNLAGPAATRYESSAKIQVLFEIEQQLAGTKPPTTIRAFDGLRSPKWPEHILGRIDAEKAKRGETLYRQICQHCHLPPVSSPEFWNDDRNWTAKNDAGERYLRITTIPVDEIGTDPMQARSLANRTIDTTGLGLDTRVYAPGPDGKCSSIAVRDAPNLPYGVALGAVVQETIGYWYAKNNIAEPERHRMDGNRPNCLNGAMQYGARPLNGIWATAPYLHNGSVPSLYALLSPLDERPAVFYLGNSEYDPVNVGYVSTAFENGFKLDTAKLGNRNTGHVLDDAPAKGNGIIYNKRLTSEQRLELIEFLKTQ